MFVFFVTNISSKNGKNYHKNCVELKSSCFSWPQIWLHSYTYNGSYFVAIKVASQPNSCCWSVFFYCSTAVEGRGLFIVEVSKSRGHTQTHHTREYSSGQVIGPSQRILPDNTQHSQETDSCASSGTRTRNPSKWAATGLHNRALRHRHQRWNINSVLFFPPFLLFLHLHSHCIPSFLNTLVFLLFTLPAGWHKYRENWQFKAVSCVKSCLLLTAGN